MFFYTTTGSNEIQQMILIKKEHEILEEPINKILSQAIKGMYESHIKVQYYYPDFNKTDYKLIKTEKEKEWYLSEEYFFDKLLGIEFQCSKTYNERVKSKKTENNYHMKYIFQEQFIYELFWELELITIEEKVVEHTLKNYLLRCNEDCKERKKYYNKKTWVKIDQKPEEYEQEVINYLKYNSTKVDTLIVENLQKFSNTLTMLDKDLSKKEELKYYLQSRKENKDKNKNLYVYTEKYLKKIEDAFYFKSEVST